MNTINLFVPGRVSIIGELSDLVVDHIKENQSLIPGEVIAGGIEKGIYATVTKSNDFRFEFNNKVFEVKDMNTSKLAETAKSNNFFSYVSSVAYLMKSKFNVSGVSIKVRYMSLPIQKGLSSSASVCVLTVKAFNELYNLKLEFNEIMELAYQAERYALSMCGRLDQICAKGLGISHIIFYENSLDVNPIEIKKELYFVVADLNGFKDTKKILSTLHSCFPFPKNKLEEQVKKTLCEDNKYLVREAIESIATGNLKYLGEILTKAQNNLDNSGGKITDALEGPVLHKVMNDNYIKECSYGSKGTGSNGDGSIIILAKNKTNQKKIIKYLKDIYQTNSFEFNIKKTSKIKKVIINTKNNYIDNKKLLKILEQLDNIGINKIIIIGNNKVLEEYKKEFNKKYTDSQFFKLSEKVKEYQIKLYRIYEKLEFVEDKEYSKETTICVDDTTNIEKELKKWENEEIIVIKLK